MVQSRWFGQKLENPWAMWSRTYTVKVIDHGLTVGFQSQAYEKDEHIHKMIHCNHWCLLIDLSVQLLQPCKINELRQFRGLAVCMGTIILFMSIELFISSIA